MRPHTKFVHPEIPDRVIRVFRTHVEAQSGAERHVYKDLAEIDQYRVHLVQLGWKEA